MKLKVFGWKPIGQCCFFLSGVVRSSVKHVLKQKENRATPKTVSAPATLVERFFLVELEPF